ncbi:MAG TPA: GNAT family N-acetyltransferase [Nevskia sp.]|jgi:ribosomal protein S18 acetylase RimI-like enzyme|nr:GNAT family N-acetyltransferase [Nevskia sp.]
MSDEEGRVRPAHHQDDAAILTLEELFPSDRMSLRSVRHFLRSPSARAWVAELQGAVVGNLILLTRKNSGTARIYSVVVAPPARGRRFAERLVRAAETEARRLGLRRIKLEVRVDNAAARALYAKLGYREDKKLPGYYEDGADGLRLCHILEREG